MSILRIPTPLRGYIEGKAEVPVTGSTVAEAMEDLVNRYPALRQHLFDGSKELRPFINLFLNEDNIKDLNGLQTSLGEGDKLLLIPSIAGGKA